MEAQSIVVPDDLYCPISGDLMVNPVSEPDHKGGHTYEKDHIERWLRTKSTSPMTQGPLTVDELSSNEFARRTIESIRGLLKSEQLKIKSKIAEVECKTFIDKLDEININNYYNDNNLFININTPIVEIRPPVDIVLCLDVSGSMGTEATMKGQSGETISHGLSVLSLTKAAAKSVLHSLDNDDNISIVVYASVAEKIVENISCTNENKALIETQIDELKPKDTTNIWDGIHTSFELLRTTSAPSKQKCVFLLTDGLPNVVPPRGHEAMIQRYFQQNDFKCPVNCYGFGYQLDSELLTNITSITGGDGFSFIPDSSLMGNIFIHGISNFLTTVGNNCLLTVNLKKGILFEDGTTTKMIEINSLKYGQSKNIKFNLNTMPVSCSQTHGSRSEELLNDFAEVSLSVNGKTYTNNTTDEIDINYINSQIFRYKFINTVSDCINLQKNGNKLEVRRLIEELCVECKSDLSVLANKFIQDLLMDLEGQVKEALNFTDDGIRKDYYSKWGRHYLYSLVDAYKSELCNNFKDKGIQNFTGELFETIRDKVDSIYNDLPAPKPDIVHRSQGYRGGGGGRVSATRSLPPPMTMQTYNTSSNPCCAHGSKIKLSDNSYKNVEDIVKGEKVKTIDNNGKINISEIECIVKSKCDNNLELLVEIDNLKITPYHPIKYNNEWRFPTSIGFSSIIECPYVYSFVIKNRNSVFIDNIEFATLGHFYKGLVIEHGYFGTNKVIDDLKNYKTYNNGYVLLNKNMIHRDNNTGLINNISNNFIEANL